MPSVRSLNRYICTYLAVSASCVTKKTRSSEFAVFRFSNRQLQISDKMILWVFKILVLPLRFFKISISGSTFGASKGKFFNTPKFSEELRIPVSLFSPAMTALL